MIRRCYCRTSPDYHRYGGRGITVCERWHNPETFIADIRKMPKLKGDTLDRIDNDGPYCPDNCRYASKKQQNRNRRDNIRLTWDGQTKIMSHWAEITGIKYATIYMRLKRFGWNHGQCLGFVPVPVGSGKMSDGREIIRRPKLSGRPAQPVGISPKCA